MIPPIDPTQPPVANVGDTVDSYGGRGVVVRVYTDAFYGASTPGFVGDGRAYVVQTDNGRETFDRSRIWLVKRAEDADTPAEDADTPAARLAYYGAVAREAVQMLAYGHDETMRETIETAFGCVECPPFIDDMRMIDDVEIERVDERVRDFLNRALAEGLAI